MTSPNPWGSAHAADKRRLLAALRDGDPCWRCGQPMYHWQKLHRGHLIDQALGGADGPAALEHAGCNLSAGGRLSHALRRAGVRRPVNPWRGQRQARSCPVCGTRFTPSHAGQKTCSREHGWILRKAEQGTARQAAPRVPSPAPPARRSRQW